MQRETWREIFLFLSGSHVYIPVHCRPDILGHYHTSVGTIPLHIGIEHLRISHGYFRAPFLTRQTQKRHSGKILSEIIDEDTLPRLHDRDSGQCVGSHNLTPVIPTDDHVIPSLRGMDKLWSRNRPYLPDARSYPTLGAWHHISLR